MIKDKIIFILTFVDLIENNTSYILEFNDTWFGFNYVFNLGGRKGSVSDVANRPDRFFIHKLLIRNEYYAKDCFDIWS